MLIFKLYPSNLTKFHIGDSNRNLKDFFSSDQLFSSLYNCGVLMFDKNDQFFDELKKVTISSMMPGIKIIAGEKEREILFLPKPILPIDNSNSNDDEISTNKKYKRIRYVSIEAFKELQFKWNQNNEKLEFDFNPFISIGGSYIYTKEELAGLNITTNLDNVKLLQKKTLPKVVISRLDDTSENFFFQEEVEVNYFKKGNLTLKPFYYFICREEVSLKFKAVVRLLADEGIGGKRSLFHGIFEKVVEEQFEENLINNNGNLFMSLSSVIPQKEELSKLMYYDLEERNGYIYSTTGRSYRKKTIRVIKEGSIFSGNIEGNILETQYDVFNKHPIFQYGRAFLIPFGEVNR
ncbi:type III-A CRISPR-associated RAMP protein Csm4 [Anaerobranca gottschalkii]|uniref:CRISPR system Cms protein Csm4 n=1 Tax=Anaerobranca gottschalkii DSM 13577 TaxID=1120990 RepID=A0A1I0A937_9FIRM|nr:type III-A CRISPR-associated RAMP protein Csm4 [Anaerobranca gottschalkii]SES90690.1 CRISPR-associated protein Csm4 [Anaerobranca gottschalkii DSM 13577]